MYLARQNESQSSLLLTPLTNVNLDNVKHEEGNSLSNLVAKGIRVGGISPIVGLSGRWA